MSAFVDSAVWIGSRFRDDPSHRAAAALLHGRKDIYTSDFVVDEVVSFILGGRRHGLPKAERGREASAFLDLAQRSGAVAMVNVRPDQFATAKCQTELHPFGLTITDWTNIILMKELGVAELLTFDRAFRKVKKVPGYEFLRVLSRR